MEFLTLPGGRRLAFTMYGQQNAPRLNAVYFHGWASSSQEAQFMHLAAKVRSTSTATRGLLLLRLRAWRSPCPKLRASHVGLCKRAATR